MKYRAPALHRRASPQGQREENSLVLPDNLATPLGQPEPRQCRGGSQYPLSRHPAVLVQVDRDIVHRRAFEPGPGRSLGGSLPAGEGAAAILTLVAFGFLASRLLRF